MKKFPLIMVVILGVALAGLAEAAPKKRTRNQNRVGPYGAAFVGMTKYGGDHSADEASLLQVIINTGADYENPVTSTDDTDIGYQATFGYRFHRYVAAEIGLVQYGELESKLDVDVDLTNTGTFVPVTLKYNFHVGGPLMSVLGILPVGEKFEVYGRAGMLFASAERDFTSRIDGQRGTSANGKGDSQNFVYGVGLSWNINQVYTVRGEYQVIDGVGEGTRTGGEEDLSNFSVGVIIRF